MRRFLAANEFIKLLSHNSLWLITQYYFQMQILAR